MIDMKERQTPVSKEKLESLQAIIDRLTVENVRLKTSDLERRNELKALRKQTAAQDGEHASTLEEAGQCEPSWFKSRLYHLSFGLSALALDGAMYVCSIAFPEWALLESGAYRFGLPYFIGAFGAVGIIGIGSGLLDEWEASRRRRIDSLH